MKNVVYLYYIFEFGDGAMLKKFYPDYTFSSINDIDFGIFTKRKIKWALLDIDNTLVSYTSPKADDSAKRFLKTLDAIDIKYCFVSNNHKKRVALFAEEFGCGYVCNSMKPLLPGINRAMRMLGAERDKTVLIGDQVFTDIYAGNRAGLLTVMVNPIEAKETPFFGFKRRMEKIVLRNYEAKK